MVRHLDFLEDLDGDDVKAHPSIDESVVDGDVIDRRRAQEGNCAHSLSRDWMIFLVEADLASRLLQPVAVDAGLCYRDLPR
jgi:hypothetical protein